MKKSYQGIYILALVAEVVPEHLREQALEQLVQLIEENGNLLATGFLSVSYLLPVLCENGKRELANTLLFRDECPSWLYEVKMGATTMWESWDAYDMDGTPKDYSMNHFAFGCVGEYLFRNIMGIKALEPGFSKVCIEPDMECGLSFVKGHYDSIWGKIEVAWAKSDSCKIIELTVPPDVTAVIKIGDNEQEYSCGTWKLVLNETGE